MRSVKFIGSWQLWVGTVREFRSGWKLYLGVAAMVIVPVQILSLSSALASDAAFGAYTKVATLIVNAGSYLCCGQTFRRPNRYHPRGVLAMARLASSGLLLPAPRSPFVCSRCFSGVVFFAAGSGAGASPAELSVVGAVALVLAAISVLPLALFICAPLITIIEDTGPWSSLKSARKLVRGRYWVMVARLIILGVWLALIAAILFGLVDLIGLAYRNANFLGAIYQLSIGLLALPLGSIYLTHLYKHLSETVLE